jgi:ferredoxin-type protein NapH
MFHALLHMKEVFELAEKMRRFIQLSFLMAFVLLFSLGKIQMWMGIFLGSVLAALLFGRFYCGWICPINTLMETINWVYRKLGLKRKTVPKWIKSPSIRYAVLAVFLAILVFTMVSGERLPISTWTTGIGSIMTLFFEPALWHRYICPHGTLLSLIGSRAKHRFVVDNDKCIKCGICKKVCPADAVDMANKEAPVIVAGSCLECLMCKNTCPKEAIKYV